MIDNKYFDSAEELMQLSRLCDDSDAANLLKSSAGKIYKLAQSYGSILKSASKKEDNNSE